MSPKTYLPQGPHLTSLQVDIEIVMMKTSRQCSCWPLKSSGMEQKEQEYCLDNKCNTKQSDPNKIFKGQKKRKKIGNMISLTH